MQSQNEELLPDENGNFSSPALCALEEVWDELDAGGNRSLEKDQV